MQSTAATWIASSARTAEILAAGAEGGPVEFWTHDDRLATAALSRGLTVRGTSPDLR